jgi:adenylate cyclase
LTAVQLVELLNEYLTAMTDILLGDMGTLDKYEGDAIIAFIGAPMNVPDHGMRACRIAVAMQDKLLELRKKWEDEKQVAGEPERNTKGLPAEEWAPGDKWPKVVHAMRMRIGVNSGEMVVGNMGSTMRMNYTMMGDAVNLAARLEAGAKQYGVFSMVSMFTMDLEYPGPDGRPLRVADAVEARFIDNIQVVGKNEPVKVYELVAMKGGLTEAERELFQRFEAAMALYLDQRWDEASEAFGRADEVERFPDNKLTPSRVFMDRCRAYKENPPVEPGQAWDGVYRMTKK